MHVTLGEWLQRRSTVCVVSAEYSVSLLTVSYANDKWLRVLVFLPYRGHNTDSAGTSLTLLFEACASETDCDLRVKKFTESRPPNVQIYSHSYVNIGEFLYCRSMNICEKPSVSAGLHTVTSRIVVSDGLCWSSLLAFPNKRWKLEVRCFLAEEAWAQRPISQRM